MAVTRRTRKCTKIIYTILLITLLRFFCNMRFPFVSPYMESSTNSIFSQVMPSEVAWQWVFAVLLGSISGAYIMARYTEKEGIFKLAIALSVGTVVSCFLLYCLALNGSSISESSLLIFARFLNVFFQPAALIVPAITVMRNYHSKNHIKVGSYFFIAAILGTQVSYYLISYVLNSSFYVMSLSVFVISVLMLACHIYAHEALKSNDRLFELFETNKKAEIRSVLMAILIGFVFYSSISYHYIFNNNFINEIVSNNEVAFGYLPFYITLDISLLIAAKFFNQEKQLEISSASLAGVLLLAIAPTVMPIESLTNHVVYQCAFAFVTASFLATSFSIVYALFKDRSRTVFNCVMWFSTGYALASFAANWFTKNHGLLDCSKYSPAVPLVFAVFCFLALLIAENVRILITKKQEEFIKCNVIPQEN